MCADLNMPRPMSAHTFQEHLVHVKSAAEMAAQQSMAEAATELREARGVTSDKLVDCRTMFDGTWRKRGHSFLQGAVTCISADNEKRGHCEIFPLMGLKVGVHSHSYYENSDSRRICASAKKSTEKEKKKLDRPKGQRERSWKMPISRLRVLCTVLELDLRMTSSLIDCSVFFRFLRLPS